MSATEHHRVSLEQWRALLAVVDAGSYARGAEALNKSQSSVTYAIQKLERQLDVDVFAIEGRRAVLTPTGQLLARRARTLIDDASRLEALAAQSSAGWEAEIGLSVEVLFPTWLMLDLLATFGEKCPHTNIELYESVLRGAEEDLLTGRADVAITPRIPTGFQATPILDLTFVPVAHPEHALHTSGRPLTSRDLRRHRHILVRETGSSRKTHANSQSEARWTVSNMATSIGAVCRGHGYAWFPQHKIKTELADGTLKRLPIAEGGERYLTMYLILADAEDAGPGVTALADIIKQGTARQPT